MGSTFTRYKSPAYVNLDFTPTFTPELLLKDFHLGFEAARELEVPMPLAAATEQIVQGMVGISGNDVDFAALLELRRKPPASSSSPRTSRSTTASARWSPAPTATARPGEMTPSARRDRRALS